MFVNAINPVNALYCDNTILRQHFIATYRNKVLSQYSASSTLYCDKIESSLFLYIYGYSLLEFIQVIRLRVTLQMLLVGISMTLACRDHPT